MQRMISSSSPSPSLGPGVGSAEDFAFLSFEPLPLPFLPGASGSSRFLCWPLVARPERRGSSDYAISLFPVYWPTVDNVVALPPSIDRAAMTEVMVYKSLPAMIIVFQLVLQHVGG